MRGTSGQRLGVVGWPVAHSRSPEFQNPALGAVGLEGWRYQRLPVPPELFKETVQALPGAGFRGVNVTIPHKQRALSVATDATPRARQIGAANTLLFGDGDGDGEGEGDGGGRCGGAGAAIEADNTDAPGLIAALPWSVEGRSALVLGAGGSARAAVWALHDAGAKEVRVWNRTVQRAAGLCADLGGEVVEAAEPADLLVNCTALGLRGEPLEALPVSADGLRGFGLIADFVYREGGTALVGAARELGIPVVDGLQILVGQGALSFERFTGRPAPLQEMRRAVGMP